LLGMANLLRRNKPKLAISVYHRPDDLVRIPNLLKKSFGYEVFSLRTFAHQSFETILYAS